MSATVVPTFPTPYAKGKGVSVWGATATRTRGRIDA